MEMQEGLQEVAIDIIFVIMVEFSIILFHEKNILGTLDKMFVHETARKKGKTTYLYYTVLLLIKRTQLFLILKTFLTCVSNI